MSDSDGSKPKGTPSWQQQESSNSPHQPDNTPPQEAAEQGPSESRASLIETASKFLSDDSIRDAPTAQKTQFLEAKGLTEAEINNILDIHLNPETDGLQSQRQERQNNSQPTPSTTPPSPSPSSQQSQPPPQSRDTPPIITYPEYLLHAQKPAPLITASRILTTLYVAAGSAATIYGTSTYILEPMLSTLTTARHSLCESAETNIVALNGRLEGVVSKVPEGKLSARLEKGEEEDEEGKETESSTSDGARFFQRSAGTQTTPRPSRSNSSASSSSSSSSPSSTPLNAPSQTQHHTSALSTLHHKLSDLLPPSPDASEPMKNPLGTSVSELQSYLAKLPHAGQQQGTDAVAEVKAEIRGVKGVLLSARNFPSGVAAR